MIQDITPHRLSNEFHVKEPTDGDVAVIYADGKVLLDHGEGEPRLPRFGDLGRLLGPGPRDLGEVRSSAVYLLTVDDFCVFYVPMREGYATETLREASPGSFRGFEPKWMAFAGITGCHLAGWYERHRLCGKCGAALARSPKERMLECPDCKDMVFPSIAPVVIVGVTDGDSLLLTRYKHMTGKGYALVAGFVEIGETFEEAVAREVLEETGVRVKNVRFYKSQPWGFSSSLLAGFYCDLDGDAAITVDDVELSTGVWMARDDIEEADYSISLTSEMIEAFRRGREPRYAEYGI